ncbi:MAG: hypothetical protein Q8M18_03985 [Bradyrhizobium sp.]|nr:hypothetical protein [Bradyrhizobium sp.]
MKYLIAAALLATTVVGAPVADAAQGCGPGFHRGPYGACVSNRRPVVVRRAPVVVAPPRVVYRRAPVVVVPRARVCPRGMVWAAGRCRY